ncbi:MAG: ribosome maturation factor RimP [Thermodesulfobacteriota bacterium]|nr:ribosome maturation factor RimP [Thermodesulfobacteriota bacterium]
MNEIYEDIRRVAEPAIEALGMELIKVEIATKHKGRILRLYIDKEGGINLDDCVTISRQINPMLDVENILKGSYTIEVSSPGLDRPLTREKDFIKYKGESIKIETKESIENRKNFQGEIVDIKDKILVLKIEEGKTAEIPLFLIMKARLIPDFKL